MFKRTLTAIAISGMLTTSAMASDGKNDWKEDAMDAWIDGKAEATLLFNGNLDSFDINTDVEDGVVTLTGKVDNDVDKELASELILGIDGVARVDNMLTVTRVHSDEMDDDDEMTAFTDAKIGTVIKSRYLFNSEVPGMDIDVDVENKEVTLNGKVKSKEISQLAEQIAKNANDVSKVVNNLTIEDDMDNQAE
ncbi:BON domain-containing protein [Glaciecola sp. 1036]|uniref:BON domain-containing protein n=1 Tax=Alteromonadaceae TaxID=72275 RepID=UPI003CFD6E24